MRDIFGSTGFMGGVELAVCAALVLGALIFRKSVANDMMDKGFSIIGSSAGGIIAFLIASNLIDSIKFSVGIGIFAWAAGGFLLAELIGDGESGGND